MKQDQDLKDKEQSQEQPKYQPEYQHEDQVEVLILESPDNEKQPKLVYMRKHPKKPNPPTAKDSILFALKFIFILLGVIFAIHLVHFFIMYSIQGEDVWETYKKTWEWYKELLRT